jgi:cell division cycle protein 37
MLSLEEQIIDATTEEGQEMMKQIEEQERLAKEGKITYDDPE